MNRLNTNSRTSNCLLFFFVALTVCQFYSIAYGQTPPSRTLSTGRPSSANSTLPATTMPVPEPTAVETRNKSKWFLKTDYLGVLASHSASGVTLSAGRLLKHTWLDAWLLYTSGNYGAFNINQSSATVNVQEGSASYDREVERYRAATGRVNLFSAGPGLGMMFKLFESERWVEWGHFGLGYARFSDGANSLEFKGALARMQGGVGYRLDPVMLSLGLSWNLSYVQRISSPYEMPHDNFLPLQWWGVHVGFSYWIR